MWLPWLLQLSHPCSDPQQKLPTLRRLVTALSLCEAESCYVSVAAFLDHLKKGFSVPLVLLHGSHDGSTGVQDAAAALAAAKEEDGPVPR